MLKYLLMSLWCLTFSYAMPLANAKEQLMSYAIRKIPLEDAIALSHLHVKAWQATYPEKYYSIPDLTPFNERIARWQAILVDPYENTLGVYVDNELLGFLNYSLANKPLADIKALYLDISIQNKGIGRTLMQMAEQTCRDENMKEMRLWVLDTNRKAQLFYEKLGFEFTQTVQRDIKSNGVVMIKYEYKKTIGQ